MALLSRRGFLFGLMASSTIAGLAFVEAAPRLRILGDGNHDDGPGLAALLRGEDVDASGTNARIMPDGTIHLAAGTYKFDTPIIFAGH